MMYLLVQSLAWFATGIFLTVAVRSMWYVE